MIIMFRTSVNIELHSVINLKCMKLANYLDWVQHLSISRAHCKTVVSPVLMHWRYNSLAMSPWVHQYFVNLPELRWSRTNSSPIQSLRNHFTKGLWAHNSNLVKIYALTWKIIIQSGHNFTHFMTAELSWHVQNYDLIGSLESKLEQKDLQNILIVTLQTLYESFLGIVHVVHGILIRPWKCGCHFLVLLSTDN